MALITCKNLSLGYGNREIISGLNFEINIGDYLYIVGENGSGKTTLMETILGLKRPAGGEIIFGDDLKQNEIGYLPQQNAIQRDFPASVYEIVLSGCENRLGFRPFYGREEKKTAMDNMQKTGISDYAARSFRKLSGGQQQRVLLARALCATKRILLLDEPASGLDREATEEMYQLIERLNKSDRITIIMISHDIDSAVRYASHIMHIGSFVFYGKKDDYVKKCLSGGDMNV